MTNRLSGEQQRTALGYANRARSDASEIRHEIAVGNISVGEALEDPRARSLTIEKLLGAQKRWGPQRLHRALIALRCWTGGQWVTIVWPDMRVRDLTERQKSVLRDFLKAWQ